jgi:hypothetical protein
LHTLLKPTKFEYISSAIGRTIFSPIVSACNNLFFFVQDNTVSYCVFRISKCKWMCMRVNKWNGTFIHWTNWVSNLWTSIKVITKLWQKLIKRVFRVTR